VRLEARVEIVLFYKRRREVLVEFDPVPLHQCIEFEVLLRLIEITEGMLRIHEKFPTLMDLRTKSK
jgi:hypothetical protein